MFQVFHTLSLIKILDNHPLVSGDVIGYSYYSISQYSVIYRNLQKTILFISSCFLLFRFVKFQKMTQAIGLPLENLSYFSYQFIKYTQMLFFPSHNTMLVNFI